MFGLVLLGDVKDSRRVKHPEALAQSLQTTFGLLNQRHARWFHAPFEIQKGIDEFGCVLKPTAPIGKILSQLWMGLHPYTVRIAISRGETMKVGSEKGASVRYLTGTAFHEAADRLGDLRRQGRLLSLPEADLKPLVRHLEHVGNLLYLTLMGWTERQMEYFGHSLEGKTQSEIAEILSLSQPTISIALHRMQARLVRPILQDWAESLPEALHA